MTEVEDAEIIEIAKRMRQGPLTMKPVELACRAYDIEYVEGAPLVLLEGTALNKTIISCLIGHYVKQNYGLETGLMNKTEDEKKQHILLYERVVRVLSRVSL